MFINPFANIVKQEDPEEAAKAEAVKAALMEKLSTLISDEKEKEDEKKMSGFTIPKRERTNSEKERDEKERKEKEREEEKEREREKEREKEKEKEREAESKPKGARFDVVRMLRSSHTLKPFMNLLKVSHRPLSKSFFGVDVRVKNRTDTSSANVAD